MRRRALSWIVAVAVSILPVAASAQPVRITIDGTFNSAPGISGLGAGDFMATFASELNPTPASVNPMTWFLLEPITGSFMQGSNSVDVNGRLSFFLEDVFGGFAFQLADGTPLLIGQGEMLFTGVLGNPTFRLGSFVMTDLVPNPLASVTNISIELVSQPPSSVVPEPATNALLASGLIAIGGLASRRRRARTR